MRSWCFDSVATEVDGVITYDREYGSSDFREVMRKLVGDGVYADPANNMQVVAGGGLSVVVQPGYCWIKGALGIVDDAETLTLDVSASGRTDLIVARFDLSLASRDIHLQVVKGTEGSSAAPELTRNDSTYDLQLARVRLGANSENITFSAITDTRFDSSVCGIVTGVIDQINASGLFSQYESVFNEFMNQLNDVLSDDVAGNLLALINAHTEDGNNPHRVTADQVGLNNVLNEKQYCISNPPLAKKETFGSGTSVTFDIGFAPKYILIRGSIDMSVDTYPLGLIPISQGESSNIYTFSFGTSGNMIVYSFGVSLSEKTIKISKGYAVKGYIEYIAF